MVVGFLSPVSLCSVSKSAHAYLDNLHGLRKDSSLCARGGSRLLRANMVDIEQSNIAGSCSEV